MNIFSRLYYRYKKLLKTFRLYFDHRRPRHHRHGGRQRRRRHHHLYRHRGQYGFHLIWFLILLGPVAYYVQEMTVRLGAVTKRGHAEAIFHAFGSFWGWFSLSRPRA